MMPEKKVVFKKACTYSQTPGLVSVKQLMIVDEDGKSFLAMRLVNERDEAVSAVTVKITEYDENGKVICVTPIDFEVHGNANAVFVPDQKIELESDTRDCDVVVLNAVYGMYVYKAVRGKVVVDYNAAEPAPATPDAPLKRHYADKAGSAGIEVKPRKMKAPFLVIVAIIVSIIAAVFAVYVHMTIFVATEKTFLHNGVEYAFENDDTSDGTDIYVIGYNGFRSRVIIPESIEGHTVKGIRDGAFKDNRSLTSIGFESELPIGDNAFEGCTSLKTVEFEKIALFGKSAFKGCSALESAVIRANMSEVPAEAFSGCTSLATVLFEETGEKIRMGARAFENCMGLRSMEFKRQIDYSKSGNCEFLCGAAVEDLRLLNFELPASLGTSISRLFGTEGKNVSLGKLYIDYIQAIPAGFARGISTLTTFETSFADSDEIGANAFNGCAKLSAFLFPKAVTAVGARAFSGTAIRDFEFSAVTEIGDGAFSGTRLETVSFKGNNVIQDIGASAFSGCVELTRVTLPVGMKNIGSNLFSGCTKLVEVQTIGDCVISSIGTEAFAGCTALAAIPALGGNIKQIGVRAFRGCTGFSDLVVPDTVTNIGVGAFAECTGVKKYTAPFIGLADSGNTGYLAGVFGGSSMTASTVVPELLSTVIMTKSDELHSGAFYNLKGLKSVTLPDDLKSVGSAAFYGCTGLNSIELPSSVTVLDKQAFYGCTGLNSIELPSGIVAISDQAFYGCTGLSGIELPSGLISIGVKAFYGCVGFEKLSVPGSVVTIGNSAFGECSKLTEITMPYATGASFGSLFGDEPPETLKTVDIIVSTTIPNSAFADCVNIEELTLPDSLVSVGSYVFSGCTGIKSLVIPSSVEYIGIGAISRMTALEELSTPFVGMAPCPNNPGIDEQWQFSYMLTVGSYGGYEIPRKLKKLTLTNSKIIGPYAFEGGEYIQSLVLDCAVTKIYASAFDDCYALYEVFNGSELNIVRGSEDNGGIARGVLVVHDSVDAQPLPRITYNGYTFVQDKENGWHMVDYPYENYEQKDPETVPGVVVRTELPSSVSGGGYSFRYYSIWQYLFRSAPFRSIYIPSSVVGIGRNAFEYSGELLTVEFESGSKLSAIERGTFIGCLRLHEVTVPSSVKTIGAGAFGGCLRLKRFDVPRSATSIDDGAFSSCQRLFEVYNYSDLDIVVGGTTHGGVAREAKAVYTRQQLDADPNLALPQTIIGGVQYMAFEEDGKYNWYVVDYYDSDGVLEIKPFDYIGAVGSGRVDKLKIYEDAFDFECYGVRKLVIGNVLSDITVEDFGELYALTEISIVSCGGGYDEMSIGEYAFSAASSVQSVSCDVYISCIGRNAFNAGSLEKIKFGNVGTVAQSAFTNGIANGGLTAEFGDVTEFSANALIGLGSLNRLTVGNVGVIGPTAFATCGLTSVSIASVKSVGDNAFAWCYNLRELKLGNAADIDIGARAFAGTAIQSFEYSARIASIGENAFDSCNALKSFTVGEVASIGSYAFNGCDALATVSFGGNVGSIGRSAFMGLYAIKSLTFGGNIGTIGEYAFSGCSGISSLKFNGSVNAISTSAFSDIGATSIEFVGDVGSIGARAFSNNMKLKTLSFGGGLNSLGARAFSNAFALEKLTLPDTLTSIGDYAFENCDALREVTLPSGLTFLGTTAFSGCYNVILVYNRSGLNVANNFYYPIAIVTSAADAVVEYHETREMQFAKVLGKWYLIYGYEYRRGFACVPAEFTTSKGETVKNFGIAKNALSGSGQALIGKNITEIIGAELTGAVVYYEGSSAQWNSVYKQNNLIVVLYYSDCIHVDNSDTWRYDANNLPTTMQTEFKDSDFVVSVKPTCFEQGIEVATCEHCGKKFDKTLAKLTHDIEDGKCKLCGNSATVVTSDNVDKLTVVKIGNDSENPFKIGENGVMQASGMTSMLTVTATAAVDLYFSCRAISGSSSVIIYVNGIQYSYVTSYNGTRQLSVSLKAGDVLSIEYYRSGAGDTVGAEISNMTVIYPEEKHDNA